MKHYNNTQEFYKSKEWSDCKAQVLHERLKEGVVYCECCHKPILSSFNPNGKNNKGAMVFHHKIFLNNQNVNDPSISINPKNIAVLHWACHNEVHNRFNGSKPERKVYIITGAPCSGKTTFVKERIQEGDILLDIDDLWQALSGQARYVKPNSLKEIIFPLRRMIKDLISKGGGSWRNAYLIESKLYTPKDIESECDKYKSFNVEVIEMETTLQECLNRLYKNPNGRDIALYEKLIKEYYERKAPPFNC